jgi:uridine phosphorylase
MEEEGHMANTIVLKVNLSQQECSSLAAMAASRGLPLGAMVRTLINEHSEHSPVNTGQETSRWKQQLQR